MSSAVRSGEKSSSAVQEVEETIKAGLEGDKVAAAVESVVKGVSSLEEGRRDEGTVGDSVGMSFWKRSCWSAGEVRWK